MRGASAGLLNLSFSMNAGMSGIPVQNLNRKAKAIPKYQELNWSIIWLPVVIAYGTTRGATPSGNADASWLDGVSSLRLSSFCFLVSPRSTDVSNPSLETRWCKASSLCTLISASSWLLFSITTALGFKFCNNCPAPDKSERLAAGVAAFCTMILSRSSSWGKIRSNSGGTLLLGKASALRRTRSMSTLT